MADGLAELLLGRGHDAFAVTADALSDAMTADVAVVMLTEVNYRTGARLDMKALTKCAHAAQERGAVGSVP